MGLPTPGRVGKQIRLAFAATAALLVFAVAAYAGYALHFEKATKWWRLHHIANFVSETSCLSFDHYRSGFMMLSGELAGLAGLRQGLATAHVDALLTMFRHAYPALSALVLLGPHGHMWAQAGDPIDLGLPWVREHLPLATQDPGQSLVVGRPRRLDGIRGIPLWYVARQHGQVQFAIMAILPLAAQQTLWARLSLPPQTVLGLMNPDNYLESRWPVQPRSVYRHKATGVLAQALARHPAATRGRYEGVVSIDGHYRLGSFQRSRKYKMIAFVSIPITSVLLAWWHIIQGPVALLLIVLGAIYVAYRWALRRQIRWEEERKQVEAQLFEAKERSEVTLRSIMDAVIATDIAGRIQYVNPTAERVTGWSQAETEGRQLNEIFPCLDEYNGMVLDPIGDCLEGRAVGPEDALLFHRDGRALPVERTAAPIRGRHGEVAGVVLVFRDVTEKRVLTERLAYQATHDPLTELPNRALYNSRLERAIVEANEHNGCVALLFLDLDGFKGINDSLGHGVGDRVLVAIAERLQCAVRITDTLARVGGDEFAVVLPGLRDRYEVLPVIHKIMAMFDDPILTTPEDIFLGASIGIAIYPTDCEDGPGLSRSADVAMYKAKAAGKNTYQFFESDMHDQALDRLSLEAHLHRALEHNEFHLVYQPQVRLSDGRLSGVDVLLRWVHPTDGLKHPAEFLAAADELGLTVPLGEWALRSACAQSEHWRALGVACVPIAVNMTGRQCRHEGTSALVANILRAHNLRPRDLIIDLTEELFVEESGPFLTKLQDLKDQGLGLVIQNFGAGFSPLGYLKRIGVSALKIDYSLVAGIGDQNNEAVIIAIIALGHALGIEVIAGGVETTAQYRFLKGAGCDIAQGAYIAPPLVAAAATEFFRSREQ